MNINVGYGISIWDAAYRYGNLPHRYGHPGYRYGIWANDMEDDSIDMDILRIDMGYLVTLVVGPHSATMRDAGLSYYHTLCLHLPRPSNFPLHSL
jgi:hypothetical protein